MIWKYKTTITDPASNETDDYFNDVDELMLQSFQDTNDADGQLVNDVWNTYYRYNGSGELTLEAAPSALVNGFDESDPDLVNYMGATNNGTQYVSTSNGVLTTMAYNSNGTAPGYLQSISIQQGSNGTPIKQSAWTYIPVTGPSNATIYAVATMTVFGNANSTDNRTTTYVDTYTGFTLTLQAEMLPPTSDGNSTVSTYFDNYGRVQSVTDGDGYTTSYTYDDDTGAITETDQAVGHGSPDIITSAQVDDLGRPIDITDGNGHETNIQYTDGLTTNSILTIPAIGPEQMIFNNVAMGFTDTYTLAQGTLESLTRTDYNAAGQVLSIENYFKLAGINATSADASNRPLGTLEDSSMQLNNQSVGSLSAGNYYQTLYTFDNMGRQTQVTDPLGTVTRTTYDALGRIYEVLVGKSAASLAILTQNIYDNNGVGDSDLTYSVNNFGEGSIQQTSYYYNWRDQLVAQNNGGIQLIGYVNDNLGEVTSQTLSNASNSSVSNTANPAITGVVLARTDTLYDASGEVTTTIQHNIDPTSGTDSGNVTTTYSYDGRGDVIETDSPTGLASQTLYNGAGEAYQQTQSAAATGAILQQANMTYDGNGNLILTSTTNYNSSGGGTSQTDNVANYYDSANRLIETADFGSHSADISFPPAANMYSNVATSATALVTTYGYDAAGFANTTTDPRGIVTSYVNDPLGRHTSVTQSNETTRYVYDGLNHSVFVITSVNLVNQETEYRYGNTLSNDLLSHVYLPTASGTPAGVNDVADQETFDYNLGGQLMGETGRDDVKHTYNYNQLGEETSDYASIPPSGGTLDGTVQSTQTTYNALGDATKIQSLGSDGSVKSEVDQKFNGLGELTSQQTQGSIQTGIDGNGNAIYGWANQTTSYNYFANGTLSNMTYPDGYVLSFNYADAMDAAVGRPTSYSDSSGTLANFTYLGASTTITGQTDTQASGLTLAVTLDAFGGTSEQKWTSGSGTPLADDKYLYDGDGNVLYNQDLVNPSLGSATVYSATQNKPTGYQRGNVTISGASGSISGNATVTQALAWDPSGSLLSNTVNGTVLLNNPTPNAQDQDSTNDSYAASGNTANFTNAANSTVTTTYDAWGRPVKYTVTQSANSIAFTQTETIQYDALGRVLGEFVSSDFPGQGTPIEAQHTYGYDALTGQTITDINKYSGAESTHYVYAPNGTLMLRKVTSAIGNGTTTQTLYALTDPQGSVEAIAASDGAVQERYVYDALGNAQALQANGTLYSVAIYGSPTGKSANWLLQEQFAGSAFNTSTQLLNSEGTQFAWNILYQGQFYDGVPGVYTNNMGTDFNPRQQDLLTPDLGAIAQGLSAYDPGSLSLWDRGVLMGAVPVAAIGGTLAGGPLGGYLAAASVLGFEGGYNRNAAGQTIGQIIGGGLADGTGASQIYGGLYNQDIATGANLNWSGGWRAFNFALGALQFLPVAAAGAQGLNYISGWAINESLANIQWLRSGGLMPPPGMALAGGGIVGAAFGGEAAAVAESLGGGGSGWLSGIGMFAAVANGAGRGNALNWLGDGSVEFRGKIVQVTEDLTHLS